MIAAGPPAVPRITRPDPLPEPDDDARRHSDAVVAAVHAAIDAAGGFLPFAEYMRLVLYAPGLGYYVAGARKFGPAGDFVTAPELTPLFGEALATQVGAILDATQAREIVELGAGSGRLAADVIASLAAAGAAPSRYRIVEVSPELRERQRATLAASAGACSTRVEWFDAPPNAIDGCVLMNEVLDAIPPDIVVRRGGVWLERGVAWHDGALALAERPLDDDALRAIAEERFPPGIDYAGEIGRAAEALAEDLGRRLVGGAMLVVDYGFPRKEFYHPQRGEGTLMGHYRHRAHGDPFLWPGLSDLTVHVDFTAIAEAGVRAGLSVAGFASQAAFLLGCGILDRLARFGEPGTARYVEASANVQRLMSPAEMGELFKVLALARSDHIDWTGFALADARARL